MCRGGMRFMSKWIPLIKDIYFTDRGRLDCKRYFIYTMGIISIWLIVYGTSVVINNIFSGNTNITFYAMLYSFAFTSIPLMLLFARRLHDRNVPGAMMFAILIPPVNIVLFLVMCLWGGTHGRNDYGEDPAEIEGLMPISTKEKSPLEIKLSQISEADSSDDPLSKVDKIFKKISQYRYGNLGLSICFIVIVVYIGNLFGDDLHHIDNVSKTSIVSTESVKSAEYVSETKKSTEENKKNPNDIEVKSDLSLGGLGLGDTEEMVQRLYGIPDKKETEGKYVRWYYSDIQVIILEGKVHALLSMNDRVSTKRGFHEKSSMNEIVRSYGKETSKYEEGKLVIYEYRFNSDIGIDGLLRYAFNKSDHTVNYISVRIPDEWLKKDNKEEEAAKRTLKLYHKAITEHNFTMAYDFMSPKRKESMGSIAHFAEGYKETICSEPKDIKVQSTANDEIVLTYILDAKDSVQNGRIYIQQFECKSSMFKVNGSWLLGYTEAKRISEKFE